MHKMIAFTDFSKISSVTFTKKILSRIVTIKSQMQELRPRARVNLSFPLSDQYVKDSHMQTKPLASFHLT